MTYIKWLDELESYLGSLNKEEREKVFSYFSEMYADKHDLGLSEEEIVEGFGSPYDAAQRILAENAERADKPEENADAKAAQTEAIVPTQGGSGEEPAKAEGIVLNSNPTPPQQNTKAKRRLPGWAIALIVVGSVFTFWLGIFLLCLGLNGWRVKTEYVIQSYTSEESTAIDLELSAGKMNVIFYEGDGIIINYPASDNGGYTVTEENGTLYLKSEIRHVFFFSIGEIPDITLKIPKNKAYDFKLDLKAGELDISDGEFGSFEIDMKAGDIDIDNIKCTSFKTDIKAGDFSVKSLECSSAFKLDAGGGAANINSLKADEISVQLKTGSASLNVVGREADYAVTVSKTIGSCNLSQHAGEVSGKTIAIDLTIGSVAVNFIAG